MIADSGKDAKLQLMIWIPGLEGLEDQFRIEGQTLIADLTADQHKLLAQTLEIWKSGAPRQILIEARCMQTSVARASSIDWIGSRIAGVEVKGAMAARVSNKELGDLVRSVSASQDGKLLFAPKVTVFDGQKAVIANEIHRPFVTGIDSQHLGRLEPVVSVIDEGLRVIVTPLSNGEDTLSLRFEVRVSKIENVSYANLPMRLPNRPEPHVTIEVPALVTSEVSSAVQLKEGETVIVAIPNLFNLESARGTDATLLVALTPRFLGPRAAGDLIAPAVSHP
jgi:hypothetical protein